MISNRVNDLIPSEVRRVFEFPTFNDMQVKVYENAFCTTENMVVAAPTGSGKTVVHELAILQLYLAKGKSNQFRCVYIAPNKALCQQRWTEWNAKFEKYLNLLVLEVTGDTDYQDCLRNIAKASIIVTTPEKWDSLTRCWRDHVFLLGKIDLLLVDEIHHLNDDRGAVLETVIVRMRFITQTCATKSNVDGGIRRMRIVALSATLPNINDIAEWLNCKCVHYFGDEYRPVPLQIYTIPFGSMHNEYLFEKSLDNKVKEVVNRYSNGRQTLIFCASKNGAQALATKLFDQNTVARIVSNTTIDRLLNQLQDETLRKLAFAGYGYHHAGLPADDRSIVERLYMSGFIRILCSTSTLAHGVNLPAHLVIIKGTYSWRGSGKGYVKLSRSDIIQMLGRAGRPGLDTSGVAVIMTSREDLNFYSNISTNAEVVNSQLSSILHEAIVAEISQKVITTLAECIQWILSTYYYVRIKNTNKVIVEINQMVETTCNAALRYLHSGNLIIFDELTSMVEPRVEANIMTKNLTKCKSMLKFMSLESTTNMSQLLSVISTCDEVQKPIRKLEKRVLNELKSNIRFSFKEKVSEPSQKCNVLLQMAVNNQQRVLKDFTLRVEQAEMVDSALRLLRSVQELSIVKYHGMLLKSAILVERGLRRQLWEKNSCIYYQCQGLSDELLNKLDDQGYHTLAQLVGEKVQQIIHMFQCTATEANYLYNFISTLSASKLIANMYVEGNELKFHITPDHEYPKSLQDDRHNSLDPNIVVQYQLVCYENVSGKLLCHRRIPRNTREIFYSVPISSNSSVDTNHCYLFANYVGIDFTIEAPSLSVTAPNSIEDIGNNSSIRQTSDITTTILKSKKTKNTKKSLNPIFPDSFNPMTAQTSTTESIEKTEASNPNELFMPSLVDSILGSEIESTKVPSMNKYPLEPDILGSKYLLSKPTAEAPPQCIQKSNSKAAVVSRHSSPSTEDMISKRLKLDPSVVSTSSGNLSQTVSKEPESSRLQLDFVNTKVNPIQPIKSKLVTKFAGGIAAIRNRISSNSIEENFFDVDSPTPQSIPQIIDLKKFRYDENAMTTAFKEANNNNNIEKKKMNQSIPSMRTVVTVSPPSPLISKETQTSPEDISILILNESSPDNNKKCMTPRPVTKASLEMDFWNAFGLFQ